MQTELKSSKGEAAALGPIPAPEETGPESTPVMSRQSKAGGQAGGHVEARVSKGENIASEKLHIPLARKAVLTETQWRYTGFTLGIVCVLLLSTVTIMGQQLSSMTKNAKERMSLMEIKILSLSEILKQLQTGKAQTCSMCKAERVQRANHCFFFSVMTFTWEAAIDFCSDSSSALVIVKSQDEMDFLKRESSKYVYPEFDHFKHRKFWIGLKYDTDIGNWTWTDGTPYNFRLQVELRGQSGCVYLQNGELHSQQCDKMASLICKTEIEHDWD